MNPPGTVIPFVKASACGNDFLIVEGTEGPKDLAAISRRLCDRHQGVGADGVEWLFPASDADVCIRLFNADGSEAEISGNGTRCVAAYLCVERAKEKVVVRTGAGLKTCTLTSRSETQYEFEMAMGEPQVGAEMAVKISSGEVRVFRCPWGILTMWFLCPSFARSGRRKQRKSGGLLTSSMGLTLS